MFSIVNLTIKETLRLKEMAMKVSKAREERVLLIRVLSKNEAILEDIN